MVLWRSSLTKTGRLDGVLGSTSESELGLWGFAIIFAHCEGKTEVRTMQWPRLKARGGLSVFGSKQDNVND